MSPTTNRTRSPDACKHQTGIHPTGCFDCVSCEICGPGVRIAYEHWNRHQREHKSRFGPLADDSVVEASAGVLSQEFLKRCDSEINSPEFQRRLDESLLVREPREADTSPPGTGNIRMTE